MAADDQGAGDEFAAWLRSFAEQRGYAIGDRAHRGGGKKQLAVDAELPQSVVSRALSGDAKPSIETLLALASPLGANPADLLERAGYQRQARMIRVGLKGLGSHDDLIFEKIRASGLPEEEQRKLAADYRRRFVQLQMDFIAMVEALARGEAIEREQAAAADAASA